MLYTTPEQVAEAILELIPNYRRWVKDSKYARNYARQCVVGAVDRLGLHGQIRQDFSDTFCEVAWAQYPEIRRPMGLSTWEIPIIRVNDWPGVRYDDIRVILEKIAAG